MRISKHSFQHCLTVAQLPDSKKLKELSRLGLIGWQDLILSLQLKGINDALQKSVLISSFF